MSVRDEYAPGAILEYITDFISHLSFRRTKEEIIESILKTSVKITQADYASLLLLKDNEEKIAIDYYRKSDRLATHKSSARLNTGISGKAIKDKEIVVIADTRKVSNLNPTIYKKRRRAIVAVPIFLEEEVEGILYINYSTSNIPEDFEEHSRIWMRLLSALAASAISNARLYHKLDNALKELKISFDMSRSLISAFDLNELIDRIVEEITQSFGYENIGLFIIDEGNEYITLRYAAKAVQEYIGIRLMIGEEGIVGRVAASGEPYYAPDVSKDPYYQEGGSRVRSEFSIPLKIKDKTIGVLDIEGFRLNDFPKDTRDLLISIGAQIAMAFEKARLYEETKRLSREDPLTGVLNRRRLEEEITREMARSERSENKFAILFCDLDNFKEFNDQYGHFRGDEMLISYAMSMKEMLREGDIFGRYGGDEFLLLLYDTVVTPAKKVAKRLLEKVRKNKNLPGLTLSIGVSIFPDNGRELTSLINSADQACYKAKKQGGDEFIIALPADDSS